MVDYSFVDISPDTMDMVVDAEFESPLLPLKTKDILQEVSSVLGMGMRLPILFEGLSSFQVTEKKVAMSFRFSRKSDSVAALNDNERDELPRQRTLFVIHVFAKLDHIHRLGAVPFPPDFRNLIDFEG
jgi:hypothetical protein